MPTITLEGDPKMKDAGGIPEGSEVKIVTLPDHINVHVLKDVSESVTVPLDPGKYKYVVMKNLSAKQCYRWDSEPFFVGIDEKQWERIKGMTPHFGSARHTSEGAVWKCGIIGCSFKTGSANALVLHEGKHQGIDLTANPELRITMKEGLIKENKAAKLAEAKKEAGL